MKSNKQKDYKILYDDTCKICLNSAKLFKKLDLFNDVEMHPLSKALEDQNIIINKSFAKDQIALINLESQEVYYGVSSFLELIGIRFPFIKKIGRTKIVFAILNFLYGIICYNRKIITPISCETDCDIRPSKNLFYRVVFIILISYVVNFATTLYFNDLLSVYQSSEYHFSDYIFFFGQLVFQFLVFKLLKQKNYYDYIGHVAFVSYLGAIQLIIFYIGLKVLSILDINISMLSPLCFGAVLWFMFREHARRVKIEYISAWLTYSWVLYRILIYPLAFKL